MPLSLARRLAPAVLFALLAGGLTVAARPVTAAGWGQPPPEEEEEKKPPAPLPEKKPAEEPKEKEPPKEEPKEKEEPKKDEEKKDEPPADGDEASPYLAKLPNLRRAADTTPHPELKPVFDRFAVAFDQLDEPAGKETRVTPLPLLWGADRFPKEFGVAELQPDGTAGEPRAVLSRRVRGVEPFERLAREAAARLVGPTPNSQPPKLPLAVRLEAAERLLREVLFFHDAARTANRRRGKAWDKVKAELDAQLADVRVQLVQDAGTARDWPRLKALVEQFLDRYKADRGVLERLYAARLLEAVALVKSERLADLEQARLLLADYESRFPGGPAPAAKTVREALGRKAKEFLQRAEREAANNKTESRRLLDAVQALEPDNPDVRELRRTLKTAYPTLVVGTRRLPERMSPALARFDSEHQAVELLFEGLLEQFPDDVGGYGFRPALAATRPAVGGGVRDVELVRNADWGGAGPFDANDVFGTWLLNRQNPGSWAAAPNAWLGEPQYDPGDPGRIRLRFAVGHPDSRVLLTQKILPATYLRQNNIKPEAFARKPVGTGPFRLHPEFKPRGPTDPPADVVFVANPGYARRPGRAAQPAIQEVRFTDLTGKDPAAELRAGRVHLLTDVPTAELPQFTDNNGLGGTVKVVTAATNRRVWVLAINHRRPHFHDPEVRKAISRSIDRELLLTEVFRGGRPDGHAALTGPFPPNTWAVPRPREAAPPPLFNRDAAEGHFRTALGAPGAAAGITLGYPADDREAGRACERMAGMIADAAKAAGRPFAVTPEPLPPRVLWDRADGGQGFDLLYLPLDYPDLAYPLGLGSFLDPQAAGPGGRNVGGYRSSQSGKTPADERLAVLLDEVRRFQDWGQLRLKAEQVHAACNEAVPFVPLWQLDRHLVVATAVKVFLPNKAEPASPAVLDATTLFSGVGRWRVE